jgi:histidinol-phosphate aminotransferase
MNTQKALELINQSVRDLQAYHLSPEVVAIKLNQNENPFDWPAEVKDAAAEFCRTRPWNRYPEFVPGTLKELVASYAGLRAENVIVGNGSNEMLLTLLLALTTPERTVIISQPTFTVYQLLTRGLGRRETAVYMRPDLQFDTDALLEAIRNDPEALVILCSPNNPTGGTLGEKEIRRLLEAHRGMMILDQAYIEFGGYNAVPLLSEYSNLIVTRTFSKALGAAGLRLGYMLGTAEVIEHRLLLRTRSANDSEQS